MKMVGNLAIYGVAAFIGGWAMIGNDVAPAEAEAVAAAEVARLEAEAAACRKDLHCWGDEHDDDALVYCRRPIADLGLYAHEWTRSFGEPMFSHLRWADAEKGQIAYMGDHIQFQNPFGAWVPHIYTCVWDPASETVLEVSARPGRLQP
jgi:hypothetical protein